MAMEAARVDAGPAREAARSAAGVAKVGAKGTGHHPRIALTIQRVFIWCCKVLQIARACQIGHYSHAIINNKPKLVVY